MKKLTLYLGLPFLGLVFWIVGLGCWPFVQWSTLNCLHEDIDINSGQIRRQRFLAGICVKDSVEESYLSRLVSDSVAGQPPEWRRVNTFSPLVNYSPHYRYHGAIFQVHEVEWLCQVGSFTPAAERQMAVDVLSLWQLGKGYHPVDDYLYEIGERVTNPGRSKTIDKGDLPSLAAIRERHREPPR
jgi:hypothetical protein